MIGRIVHWLRLRTRSRAEKFEWIHNHNYWADDESRSGCGSRLDRTENARRALSLVIQSYGIRSVVDVGCGDFNWLQHTDLTGLTYTGVDISSSVIESNRIRYDAIPNIAFRVQDTVLEAPPQADLVLCRDVLYHLSFRDTQRVLMNICASSSRFLLATTHPATSKNKNIVTGSFRFQNLLVAPFSLPKPIASYDDAYGEQLALWRTEDIPW